MKLGRIFALLAAIMLVIGGEPSVAAAKACDPCPPDCPMMKAAPAQNISDHSSTPAKGGKADNPCQQMVACQTVAASVAPSEQVSFAALSAASVTHEAFDPLRTPSRPPDRSLRPPIQL